MGIFCAFDRRRALSAAGNQRWRFSARRVSAWNSERYRKASRSHSDTGINTSGGTNGSPVA
jgi:hypothetical protein